MENLEKFIKNKKDFFDDVEPSDGHFERFSTKISLLPQPENRLFFLMKAASIAIIFALSAFWVFDYFIQPFFTPQQNSLSDVSEEYYEVEIYYKSLISEKSDELNTWSAIQSEEEKNIIHKELKEMDKTYDQLQKELKANPNDERIIHAMIQHYITKLEIMNKILSQLKTIQSKKNIQKPNSYETVKL